LHLLFNLEQVLDLCETAYVLRTQSGIQETRALQLIGLDTLPSPL